MQRAKVLKILAFVVLSLAVLAATASLVWWLVTKNNNNSGGVKKTDRWTCDPNAGFLKSDTGTLVEDSEPTRKACRRWRTDCATRSVVDAGDADKAVLYSMKDKAEALVAAQCVAEQLYKPAATLGRPPGLIIEKHRIDENENPELPAAPMLPKNYHGTPGLSCDIRTTPYKEGGERKNIRIPPRFYWILAMCGGRGDDPKLAKTMCQSQACVGTAPLDQCGDCGFNWPSSLALHYLVGMQLTPAGKWKFVRSASVIAPPGKVIVFRTIVTVKKDTAAVEAVAPGFVRWRNETHAARYRQCGETQCVGHDDGCVDSEPTSWVLPYLADYDERTHKVAELGANPVLYYEMLRLFVGQGDWQAKYSPLDILTATEQDPEGCPGFGPPGWIWVYCCNNGTVPHPTGGPARVSGAHCLFSLNAARANVRVNAGIPPKDQQRCGDAWPESGELDMLETPFWGNIINTVDLTRMYLSSVNSTPCFSLESNVYSREGKEDDPLHAFNKPGTGGDSSLFFRTRGMADVPVVALCLFDRYGMHTFRWFPDKPARDGKPVGAWPATSRALLEMLPDVVSGDKAKFDPVPRTDEFVDWYASTAPEAVSEPAWLSYPGVSNNRGMQNTGLVCGKCLKGHPEVPEDKSSPKDPNGRTYCEGGAPSQCWWNSMTKVLSPWPPNFRPENKFMKQCVADPACKAFLDRQQAANAAGVEAMGTPEDVWKDKTPTKPLYANLYGTAVACLVTPPETGSECDLPNPPESVWGEGNQRVVNSCKDCCVIKWKVEDKGTDGSRGTWHPVEFRCSNYKREALPNATWDPRSCPGATFG